MYLGVHYLSDVIAGWILRSRRGRCAHSLRTAVGTHPRPVGWSDPSPPSRLYRGYRLENREPQEHHATRRNSAGVHRGGGCRTHSGCVPVMARVVSVEEDVMAVGGTAKQERGLTKRVASPVTTGGPHPRAVRLGSRLHLGSGVA